MSSAAADLPEFARRYPNLALPALGAEAIFATDDFFADKARLIDAAEPVFIPGKYDDHGKWMDGWESRRRRGPGHDWCVVRLGVAGRIMGVDIDTRHFTGNFPPAAALDGCAPGADPEREESWTPILAAVPLKGDSHHYHAIDGAGPFSHVRLHIYPDGGVARLRVHGVPERDWSGLPPGGEIDLAALENGGIAVAWSDAHYGNPSKMLAPGRGVDMGDGWETRRRREPGNEWAIVALGVPGTVRRIVVDTAHYKGNFPDRVSIQAARLDHAIDRLLVTQSMFWATLLPETKMAADAIHTLDAVAALGPVTHVRVNSIPDGGISRLRLFGAPERP